MPITWGKDFRHMLYRSLYRTISMPLYILLIIEELNTRSLNDLKLNISTSIGGKNLMKTISTYLIW